jgi:hypothetical protein
MWDLRNHPGQIYVMFYSVAVILRLLIPAERIAMGFAANRAVRLVIEGSIRSDHPDWSDSAVRAAVAKRMLNGAV